jgi:hypothetical protein
MRKRWRALSLILAVLFLAALSGLGIYEASRAERHYVADLLGVRVKNDILATFSLLTAPNVETDDLAPIANDSLPPYAVNVFFEQEVDATNITRSLDLIKAAGFRYIKQELIWNDVEQPRKGMYSDRAVPGKSSWVTYDRIVELARSRGIEVIFRIDTSPQWARTWTSKIETPPQNYGDYADFVAAVVQRYRGRVHYYQIWNEPNWAFEWGDSVADPYDYVALLKAACLRARAVDPTVVILSASLAPTIENSDRAITDVSFLQQMYDAGAKPYFDVLSVNAYGLRNGPDDWRFNRQDDVNFSRPVLMREIMVRNGDSSKPIWASEIGWDALPASWTQLPLLFGSVSRDVQAEYTTRAYARAAEQWPWMDVMAVWHFRKVHPEDVRQQDYYFDLVSSDWIPEPVYYSLKALLTAPPVVRRGFHQEDYWALSWSPGWSLATDSRASLGQYRWSATAGATLRFDLEARWLDLVTAVGPNGGTLSIAVDGQPYLANRVTIVGPHQAVVDLRDSAERWSKLIPIADGLPLGVHHVELRVLSGEVVVDGLVAEDDSPRNVLLGQIVGSVIGITTGVVALLRRPSGVICLHCDPVEAP